MRETQRKNMKMRKKIKIWFYFPFFWQTSHYIVAGKEKKMFFFRKIKKINENERITWNQLRSIRMVFCIYNDLLYDTASSNSVRWLNEVKKAKEILCNRKRIIKGDENGNGVGWVAPHNFTLDELKSRCRDGD